MSDPNASQEAATRVLSELIARLEEVAHYLKWEQKPEQERAVREAIAVLATPPAPSTEAAFKAGYHCRWHRDQGAYCFDPAMSPGDPEGAFAAWQTHLGATPPASPAKSEGCINCGEANDGGYMGGKGSDEGALGPFCSQCWGMVLEEGAAPPASPSSEDDGRRIERQLRAEIDTLRGVRSAFRFRISALEAEIAALRQAATPPASPAEQKTPEQIAEAIASDEYGDETNGYASWMSNHSCGPYYGCCGGGKEIDRAELARAIAAAIRSTSARNHDRH